MKAFPDYVELHAVSNFSFLRGASHPGELVTRALELGYGGLAITDECSVAGVVRAHQALRDARKDGVAGADEFKLLIGSEFDVHGDLHGDALTGAGAGANADIDHRNSSPDAQPVFKLIVIARNRRGYGLLCEFITRLRRAQAGKGHARLHRSDIQPEALEDCLLLLAPSRANSTEALEDHAQWLLRHFKGRGWLALALHNNIDDACWQRNLQTLSERSGVPLVATGDVHMHARSRKPLQDVLSATRLGMPLHECGLALERHAERHLRSRLRLSWRYPADALAETLNVAAQCRFRLNELKYEYPEEIVPPQETPATYLRKLVYEGSMWRYPDGVPDSVVELIEKELSLITELGYEKYFLTVYDIVRFARSEHILCQGRGSAANSVVCFCLGVTEVNPEETTVLFERFISRERNEPPDIDVDFEHERREEVIQYLYKKYGRDRTALTATVISYRTRSALRDVGKALGFDAALIDSVTDNHQWWDGRGIRPERLTELGLNPDDKRLRQWQDLSYALIGFPRHLSQHVGGFVIAGEALSSMVPIENATMAERSVIQWDKDDLDVLGLLKVDVLALGMLTALRKSLAFVSQRHGRHFSLDNFPREDKATYDMICKADTVGVFQIESRAQMSMLPRLQPRKFYDLVVEVALVRPGPIQGGMVHPYLQRRQEERENPGSVISPPGLEKALDRTLGIPIFQEQVMQIVVDGANFTHDEADALRRSMAAWKRHGDVNKFQERVIKGLTDNKYEQAFAERIFEQIKGFGSYGFPESHAASFAILVYASAWVKCHEPAAFLAGLLNSQPLGFYSPNQLVQDAKRHGVEVRPPDVMHSNWDCTLEARQDPCDGRSDNNGNAQASLPPDSQLAVRLGLRLIASLSIAAAQRIVQARDTAAFVNVDDLARRADLDQSDMRTLAAADALMSLSGHRRQQVWEASALHRAPALLREAPIDEDLLTLPHAPEGEEIVFDYASLGLTLRRHPLALLRPQLSKQRLWTAEHMRDFRSGQFARACGIVTVRQQPETASGVIFVTLEDETGTVNAIVWHSVRDKYRRVLLRSRLLAIYGIWQREGEVRHLIAHHLRDLTPLLGRLNTHSRDFH
jgi:error-prone DNA polymerase